MDKYRSHKVVEAALISDLDAPSGTITVLDRANAMSTVTPTKDWWERYKASNRSYKGGYYVKYDHGYDSWSPADVFAEGYEVLAPDA